MANNVAEELRHPIDKHSRSLIIDTMKLLLTAASAFMTASSLKENANNDLLARFELLLNNYYHSVFANE